MVPVFDGAFSGMARAHAIAAIIEDTTGQQGLGLTPCTLMIVDLLVELGLHRFEQSLFDLWRVRLGRTDLDARHDRFRTTPARKPRTECCCQPVSLVIAAIVAPAGERNIASTLECFELRLAWLIFAPSAGCRGCFAAATSALLIVCFWVDFDIEILHSVRGDVTPHHRSPATAMKPAGQDLGTALGAQSW